MGIERFEQLDVWQKAHGLVLHVYQITSTLPSDEKYGLISQMRRGAIPVPASVAEGFKRRGRPDKVHFYNMAQSSLEELRYYFILCRELGYKLDYDSVAEQADQVARMLEGLAHSVNSRR